MKVTYPLKDITNENVENKLGSKNKYGKYPIGIYNAWHGGIHLEDKAKELQAIADGRVIAYRLAEEEKEESVDSEIDKEQKYNYSNSFILIQHDYKSPEGLEMTFYSVYHHLLSKIGIEQAGLKLPKILTQTETKVKDDLQQKIEGLVARTKASYDTKEFAIPKGAIVMLDNTDTLDTHWSKTSHKKSIYKKVYYTDYHNITHYDIYIPTTSKYVAVDQNNTQQLTIIATNGKENRAEEGENLRETSATTGTIINVVKSGTKVTNLEKKGSYTKIKYTQENGTEQEGYIWTESLEEKESFDESILDQIQASDLKIKAGQPIGYVGKYGVEKSPKYTASHLEVFTTNNVAEFLENTKNDGKDKQHFATVPKETKLKTNLEIAINIKENTPIKILKFEDDYAQVEITSITAILYRDRDINNNIPPHNSKKLYTIKDLEAVNKAFNGLANVNTTFKSSQVKKANTSKNWEEDLSRKITFYPDDYNKKYWISKSDVAQVEIGECNEEDEEVITYENAVVRDTTKTNKAITKAYIEPPIENCDEETGETIQEETVNKEHITNLSKFKKVTESKDKVWYKAELTYKIDEKEETKKGWLAEKDIELFSAYDWDKFGFQKLNAGSEFVYSLKDQKVEHVNATVPKEQIAPFIKTVWDIIDTDGDKKLTPIELELAFEDPEKVETLSKLVCTHKSEWSYETEKIKSEAEEIYNLAMGNNPSEELKKQVESRILALEDRMKELMFWKEAKNLAYIGEVDDKLPPRIFPNTDMVHYFHPIAFIRQMLLINGNIVPWMKIALEEAKKAKFIKETLSPTTEMANKYHTYVGKPNATGSTAWCASFVNWCLNEAGQKNAKSAGSQSILWNEGKLFKRIDEPVYGCIVLMTNYVKSNGKQTPNGHVTFLYGLDANGDLVCLGGNQRDRLKFSRYYNDKNKVCSTFEQYQKSEGKVVWVEQKFNGFFLPIDYPISNTKQLEVFNRKKLNDELSGSTVKSDSKNEKTT